MDDDTFNYLINTYTRENITVESLKEQVKKIHDRKAYLFQQKYPTITTSSYINDDLDHFPQELISWKKMVIDRIGIEYYIPYDFTHTRDHPNDCEVSLSKEKWTIRFLTEETTEEIQKINDTYFQPSFLELSFLITNSIELWFLKCAKFVAYDTDFPFIPTWQTGPILSKELAKKMDNIYMAMYSLTAFPELVHMFVKDPTSSQPFKVPHPFSKNNQYSISWREANGISFKPNELSELDVCDWHDLLEEYSKIQTIPTLIVLTFCMYRFKLKVSSAPKFPRFINEKLKSLLCRQLKKRINGKNVTVPPLDVQPANRPATRTNE